MNDQHRPDKGRNGISAESVKALVSAAGFESRSRAINGSWLRLYRVTSLYAMTFR